MATRFSTLDTLRSLRGNFKMRILDKSGRVLKTYDEPNLIVTTGRIAMSKLVSDGLSDKVITKFGVGTNQDVAMPTDETLSEMYSNNLTGHDFPEEGTVRFLWKLGYDEANGLNISEFGLLCEDGSLFSRKVREPIFKASDLAFDGEWSIIF